MPSGRVHEATTIILSLGIAACSVRSPALLPVALGAAAGIFVSPDEDMRFSRAGHRWGAWRLLWRPYAAIFAHRGISHVPVLGTLSRLLYLALPVTIVLWLLGYSPPPLIWQTATLFVVGLSAADTLHLLLDIAGSWAGGHHYGGWHRRLF